MNRTMNFKSIVLFFMLIGSLFGAITGAGSSADPYLITTAADWATFAGDSATYWGSGVYVQLAGNIDFSGGNIAPCDAASANYAGDFDGNGKVLANGTIVPVADTSNQNGLFEKLAATANIHDLIITGVDITGDTTNAAQGYCGLLAGQTTDGSQISNIRLIQCDIAHAHDQAGGTDKAYVGGLVGANHGTITDCYIDGGSVSANDTAVGNELYLGGMVGYQIGNSITDSYSTAEVLDISNATTIASYVGGFVGHADTATVTGCYARCKIDYTSNNGACNVGGFAGKTTSSTVSNCYTVGYADVNSGTANGYIAGFSSRFISTTIDSCYSIMTMDLIATGSNYSGGFAAQASTGTNTITNCYAIGSLFNNGDPDITALDVFGGFLGYGLSATITNCYAVIGPWDGENANREGFIGLNTTCTLTGCIWDNTVVAFADTSGDDGTSSTTIDMKTFAPWSGYSRAKWKQVNGYYPILYWQTYEDYSTEQIYGRHVNQSGGMFKGVFSK